MYDREWSSESKEGAYNMKYTSNHKDTLAERNQIKKGIKRI